MHICTSRNWVVEWDFLEMLDKKDWTFGVCLFRLLIEHVFHIRLTNLFFAFWVILLVRFVDVAARD